MPSYTGARLIFFPGCQEKMFTDGSLDIDFVKQAEIIMRLSRTFDEGNRVRVTSNNGATDFPACAANAPGSSLGSDVVRQHRHPGT
jgi:hypothetical protein